MSAEHNEQGLPGRPPNLKVVVRDGQPIAESSLSSFPPLEPALLQLGLICPQLELPLQVLRKNRESNPDFVQGKERQLLAYALWIDYPHAVPHIAKVFGTTEKHIKNWIGYVEDHMVDSWDEFDEIQEQLRENDSTQREITEERNFNISTPYSPSALWAPPRQLFDSVLITLGPGLAKVASSALEHRSYKNVAKETDHTLHGARQLIYEARKKLEAAGAIPPGYKKIDRRDTEMNLAASMGKIDGFWIGGIFYGRAEDISLHKNRIDLPLDSSLEDNDVKIATKTVGKRKQKFSPKRYYPKGKSLAEAQKNAQRLRK